MGRWSFSGKEEADYIKKVDVYWLKKHGYLEPHCWKTGGLEWTHGFSGKKSSIGIEASLLEGDIYVRFQYTQTEMNGEKKNFDYKVPLTATPCHYGGQRYWFICPWYANGIYCGRRVGTLYLRGNYFACRHCHNLTYNSRNLSGVSKVAGQAISIPELERLEKEVKCKYYAGRMTRKYKKYLRKQEKSLFQLQVMAGAFGEI